MSGANMLLDIARLSFFPLLMAFAASSDLITMTISNRICVALITGFMVLAFVTGMNGVSILSHISTGAAVLAVTFLFFARGWIGGGDAKLAAATALWFGFEHVTEYVLYASLLGGALTLFILQFRSWPLPAALSQQEWLARLHEERGGIPYGIALAAAALLVYPQTTWMKSITW